MSDNLIPVNLETIVPDQMEPVAVRIDNITEQKYLELADTMKEIVLEKDKQMKLTERQNSDYKAMLYKIYGLISFLDDILQDVDMGPIHPTMEHNLSYILSQLCGTLELM